MGNSNIKGITIEIGGDTTGLTDALKDVNKESKNTQDELKAVERHLKMNPGNADLIRQKQELLTQSIQQTSDKLETLRIAQQQVQAQFDRGEINAEQYRAFQRELVSTEAALSSYEGQLSSMDRQQERFEQAQRAIQNYMQATGQDANDLANILGTRLSSAIRDGSASTDQLEMALNRIGQRAGHAGDDLQEFNRILRDVGGNNNLDEIRQDLDRLGQSADEAEKDMSGLGTVIGALAAGGGIAGTVASALDVSSLDTKIRISMEVPKESIEAVKQAVMGVTKYGVDAEEALEAVRRQWALNKDASDEANAAIIEGAGAITKAYNGIDMIELIQEINEFAAAIGATNEEALAMTNTLLKGGFPPEQIDILAEYGLQMKQIGFDSAEIQAIFEKGVDTKSWNIDNLNDGIKEANLRMRTFGSDVPKAVSEALKGTDLSAKQLQEWGAAVAKGGKDGAQAMADVSGWLRTIEDDALRNELAIAVFGTKAEDQGDNLISIFEGIVDAQDKTIQNQSALKLLIEGINAGPATQLKDGFNAMITALTPLLLMVASFVGELGKWASENPNLIAAVVAIGAALGILVGAFAALMPAVGGVVTAWPAIVAGFSALTGPIGLAVAAIVGLGAAFVALWQNSETFRDNLTNVFNSIKDVALNVFETVAAFVGEKITWIKDFWAKEGADFLIAVESVFNGIMAVVKFVMPAVQLVIDTVWGAIKNIISGALDVIMGAVKVFSGLFSGDFSKMWEGVKSIFSGAVDLILGIMTLSFVGGIRTVIANFSKTVIGAIKTKWTSITELFKSGSTGAINTVKSMATSVINSVKQLATNFTGSISNMISNVTTKMSELKNSIISKVKEINLVEVGKDIIRGLIRGIGSMASAVWKEVTSIVDGIKEAITGARGLDIHSPSRVTKGFGNNIGEGLIVGMDDMIKKVASSSSRLSDAVQSAHTSLASSSGKSQANQVMQQQIINQSSNIDLSGLVAAITQLANQPVLVQSILDGRVISESVSRNQQQTYNIAAIAKGVQI